MKNIIIIYGGKSCEHDISIITACLAKGYFADFNVYCVYMDKNNVPYLAPNNFTPAMHVTAKFKQKVAFLYGEKSLALLKHNRIVKRIPIDVIVNCCHGRCGEDGSVAALCGLLNVPLVGSGITASAVAMDKILSKSALNAVGISTVKGFEINKRNVARLAELVNGYRYPLIVKPNTLGSSIGVAVCKDFDELSNNVELALKYDSRILCEQALTDFCELNCAAMRVDDNVSVSRVDVPTTVNDILTFDDKYIGGNDKQTVKPSVSDDIIRQVKSITEQIYSEFCFNGVIRVDYLYDNAQHKLYVNEINSIPGSLAYGLFSDVYSLTEYGELLVKQAERDYTETSNLTSSFSSSVLTIGGGKHRKK